MMTGASLAKFRGRVQDTMEALFPATITLGEDAVPLPAATGGLTRNAGLVVGGFLPAYEIAFRVRKSVLPELPDVGTRVRWVERDLTFRIMRASDPGDSDPAWRLGCEAIAK